MAIGYAQVITQNAADNIISAWWIDYYIKYHFRYYDQLFTEADRFKYQLINSGY